MDSVVAFFIGVILGAFSVLLMAITAVGDDHDDE